MMVSCKPVYFTQAVRERIQSSDRKNIEKVQFFNDEKFILVHKTATKDENIKGGKVKFKNGYYYYYIKFPKRTPAIAKDFYGYDKKRIKVYFEAGEDRFLTFGKYDKRNTYGLYGEKKKDGFYVKFEGKSFRLLTGNPDLLIKKNLNIDIKSDKRRVKGVKLD